MGLEVLIVESSAVESAEVGEEELPTEGVEGFAFVELLVDSPSVVFAPLPGLKQNTLR